MKRNISVHLVIFGIFLAAFYGAGLVDMTRLNASTAEYRAVPVFGRKVAVFLDGGSILYDSFVYRAFESRRFEVVKDDDGSLWAKDGYQGYTWTWHHLHTLWIATPLAVSSWLVARRCRKPKESAEAVAGIRR